MYSNVVIATCIEAAQSLLNRMCIVILEMKNYIAFCRNISQKRLLSGCYFFLIHLLIVYTFSKDDITINNKLRTLQMTTDITNTCSTACEKIARKMWWGLFSLPLFYDFKSHIMITYNYGCGFDFASFISGTLSNDSTTQILITGLSC